MHLSPGSIVGTIRVEPARRHSRVRSRLADDSSLASLLSSLAHCPTLDGDGQVTRLVASVRIGRFLADDEPAGEAIFADVARLADELDRQYELVSACGR
jgi:hypothetical protein